MASIICENSDDINRVQRDVFVFPGSRNPRLYESCADVPKLNLNLWQDCCSTTLSCGANVDLQSLDEQSVDEQEQSHSRKKRSITTSESEFLINEDLEERIEGLEDLLQELKDSLANVKHKLKKTEQRLNGKKCKSESGQWRNNGEGWSLDRCTSCTCKVNNIKPQIVVECQF